MRSAKEPARSGGRWVSDTRDPSISERQSQSHLQSSHGVGRANDAEGCGRRTGWHRRSRLSVIDDVEDVGALQAERQLRTPRHLEVARHSQIDDAEAGAVEKIARRVAVGGDTSDDLVLNERRRIEPLSYRRVVYVRIANELCAVVGIAVEVRVD